MKRAGNSAAASDPPDPSNVVRAKGPRPARPNLEHVLDQLAELRKAVLAGFSAQGEVLTRLTERLDQEHRSPVAGSEKSVGSASHPQSLRAVPKQALRGLSGLEQVISEVLVYSSREDRSPKGKHAPLRGALSPARSASSHPKPKDTPVLGWDSEECDSAQAPRLVPGRGASFEPVVPGQTPAASGANPPGPRPGHEAANASSDGKSFPQVAEMSVEDVAAKAAEACRRNGPPQPRPSQGSKAPPHCKKQLAWEESVRDEVESPQRAAPANHRQTVGPSGKPVRRSFLVTDPEDVPRRVGQIISGSTLGADAFPVPETRLQQLLAAAAKGASWTSGWALRLGGVVPFDTHRSWPSLIYQCLVVLLHLSILGGASYEAHRSFREPQQSPLLLTDLVLAAGAFLGLVAGAGLGGSGRLQHCLEKMEQVSDQQGFSNFLQHSNGLDALVTMAAWLAFMADRVAISCSLWKMGPEDILRLVQVALSSAELSVLVLAMLRVIRGMAGLVDTFCTRFWEQLDFVAAVSDWNSVQASVRVASRVVERCVMVLTSTMVLLALAMVFDFRSLVGLEWALTSSGLLILAMSQVLLRAASVTDACTRVPQLVNAVAWSAKAVDHERSYLVEYITASAAGFYLFNVRLDAGIAIKIFHYTGLFAFTLARAVFPSGPL